MRVRSKPGFFLRHSEALLKTAKLAKLAVGLAALFIAGLSSASSAQNAPARVSVQAAASEDQETELLLRARSEQNEFFRKMQEEIQNGAPVDTAAGSCTYISSIFNAPPAKTVVLTFDDGPTSDLTPQVLDILKKYGIKATFFNKGNQASANPRSVKRVKAEGHLIGNHSYSHPNFHDISEQDQVNEVTTADQILKNVLGKPKLFRYPYGNSTCSTNVLVKSMGYDGIVGWHVDSCDWAFSKTGSVDAKEAQICEVSSENMSNFVGHVLSEIRRHNGGIVLLHETHVRTVANLEKIIVSLKAEGFQFTNLDDPRMAVYFK